MPKEESLERNLFTWWVFPVPDADWLVGVWSPHSDQPLVIACELDTLHTMGPVGAGHPQHRPLGDDWPHQDRVLVRSRVSRGQVWPRVAPSQAADVITVTLENLQRKLIRWHHEGLILGMIGNNKAYMLLLLLDVHDDNVNGSRKCNELILQGKQTVDW